MNTSQKKFFDNWAQREKFKSNFSHSDLTLKTIARDLHLTAGFNKDESLTIYINRVHPILFIRYLGDWTKCRHISESQWREINRKWIETCWRQKWFNTAELSLFRTIDEVRSACNQHFQGNQIKELSYAQAAESLRTISEIRLEEEAKEIAKRKQESIDSLKKALESGNSKEIQKQSQEVRKVSKEEELHEFKNLTNSVKTEGKLPTSKPTTVMLEEKQSTITMKDVFESSQVDTTKLFEEFLNDDFLKSQIPSIKKNQILVHNGIFKAHYEFQPSLPYLKVKSVYTTGKNYLTFGEVPGISYTKNDENQLIIENQDLCTAFLEKFEAKKWLLLTISENISENDELEAYEIINIEKK